MALKIIHAVAIDGVHMCGGSEWRSFPKAADDLFDAYAENSAYDGHTLTRFDLLVEQDADPVEITRLVDDAAWALDYVPLRERLACTPAN